mgnify:CR=1 FL=1
MMLGCLLTGMLLMACKSYDESEDKTTSPVLNIYVYAPGRALPTRSGVMATPAENEVKELQIWVYKNTGGQPIGYMKLSGGKLNNLNNSQSEIYSLELTEDLSTSTPINVYVLANVTSGNSGVGDYGSSISKSNLEDAYIDANYYAPADKGKLTSDGIPMSGVLRDQTVTGQNSALHVKDARLDLVRAVSKIRFVFSKSSETAQDVYIDKVTLDADKLYEKEYLFLNGSAYHVGDVKLSGESELLKDIGNIKSIQDPTQYAYNSQNLNAYEQLISSGIKKGDLTADSVYIGESDQPLSGKIEYHVGTSDSRMTANFTMEHSSFPRNNTWIVYAYYGTTMLEVNTVQVKDWSNGGSEDHPVHNW